MIGGVWNLESKQNSQFFSKKDTYTNVLPNPLVKELQICQRLDKTFRIMVTSTLANYELLKRALKLEDCEVSELEDFNKPDKSIHLFDPLTTPCILLNTARIESAEFTTQLQDFMKGILIAEPNFDLIKAQVFEFLNIPMELSAPVLFAFKRTPTADTAVVNDKQEELAVKRSPSPSFSGPS